MSIFAVNAVGDIGIIRDVKPHELPPTAWSNGLNVRFEDGFVAKTSGDVAVFGSTSVAPYGIMPVPLRSLYYWLYMGLTKVYVYDGTSHTNITRQTALADVNYTGTADNLWTGGVLGGVPVLNNGVDVPQMWLPATVGTKLAALSNWPAATTAEVLRIYKQFLLALDVTKSGTRYPTTLKWSHPADPGTVPVSWDETDPTKDCGEYTFSETGDWLVDCAPLRDSIIVYKEATTWSMQYIGGVDIFRFSKLFDSFGAAAKNCAVEFTPGKHIVLTQGDIVVHDGNSAESILAKKWRTWLASNINGGSKYHHIVVQYNKEEVWCCVATGSNTFCNYALIWNWRTLAITLRELPNISQMESGIVTLATTTTDSLTWADSTEAWAGARLYQSGEAKLLMACPEALLIRRLDYTETFNGTTIAASVERTGIGIPLKQSLPPDFTAMKFCRNIWPRIEGTIGGVVNVEIGTQSNIGADTVWQTAKPYTIGYSTKIDCLASGRLLGIRFSSDTDITWKLHGYELDVDFGGNF
jgi:hypothetical protein